ncbi:MAG: alpha/beta fold hydrolase [Vicinamibacterales bacterium]
MPYLQVSENTRLFYQSFGKGEPVVFTNAGLLTHKQWDEHVAQLSNRFHTITYDWLGTGRSDRPNVSYTTQLAVDALCTLLERCASSPATLVGHGIGCHVSVLATLQRPELVKRLVLCNGAPWYHGERDGSGGFSKEFQAFWFERMSFKTVPAAEAISDLAETYLYHRPPSPAVGAAVLAQALEWPMHVFKSYTADMAELDLSPRLKDLRCETLVMHGRHDRKQRYAGGQYFAKHTPGARLVTFEESAHMIMYEEMGRFTEELARFLEGR